MSQQVIEPPTEEVLEIVRREFDLNERRVREAVELLKEWIQLQPHLPKEIVSDESRLERWLIRCKNSIEKVKRTLDLYYTLKTKVPEIMAGWDTKGDWFKSISSVFYYVPMPKLTRDYDRVIILGLTSTDAERFDVLHHIKVGQLVHEIRISEDYCRSDIYVVDLSKFTLDHMKLFNLQLIQKYFRCAFGGYSIRMKAMHFVNAAPFTDILIRMVTKALKGKLPSRIQVHGSDLTNFHEQVPKEILPTEYGGEAGSVAEHWDRWKNKIESYHDVFVEREKHRSDESRRPEQSRSSSDLLGFEGSFRKLEID